MKIEVRIVTQDFSGEEDSSVLQICVVEVGAACFGDGAHTPSKQGMDGSTGRIF